jgi:cadmium resistance protein CadD (predicted permease)
MGSLIDVSLVDSLITLALPRNLIGLIELFPIAMGIKELLELHRKDSKEDVKELSKRYIIKKYSRRFGIIAGSSMGVIKSDINYVEL